MSKVILQDIHKYYGGVKALNGISFECRDREFMVILGPSGAGKTSTLKTIAGLEDVTRGDILFDEECVTCLPPQKRSVSMVFESYALYPHMTVFENLASPLRNRFSGLTLAEIQTRVNEVANLLQIQHLLGRRPAELSGGQKQRVSMGRALAKRAQIMLMDEPLSHLDAKLRHQMRRELKKYQKLFNTTVIYVTHDYLEALSLADRIVVLNMGHIHQTGTPAEVYNQPRDIFVASFIGHPKINLIPCIMSLNQEEKAIFKSEDGDFSVTIPHTCKSRAREGENVWIGIRPQHFKLNNLNLSNGIRGTVYVSELLETKSLVEVKVGQNLLRILSPVHEYKIGDTVMIDVSPENIMVFERNTGKNLRTEAL